MKKKFVALFAAAGLMAAVVTGCQGAQAGTQAESVPGQDLAVDDTADAAGTEAAAADTAGTDAAGTEAADTAGTGAAADTAGTGAAAGTGTTGTGTAAGQAGQPSGASITEEDAKRIALEDAGVSEADILAMQVGYEMEHGRTKYEIEFYAGNMEYDYEINAETGEIISFDQDIEYDFYGNGAGTGNGGAQTTLTQDEVTAIVLERVPGADTSHLRLELDRDDGRMLYEGEIIYDGVEYEFEIDAQTGNVIEWSEERF